MSEAIDGAHNWCDRWCERCPLVARCPMGRAEQAASAVPPLNRAIGRALRRVGELVDAAPVEALDWRTVLERARADPLQREADAWTHLAADWLEWKPPMEATEVVGRYLFLVPAKVHRALHGGDPDDALGTAKVVTLALRRVIERLSEWVAENPHDRTGSELIAASSALIGRLAERFPGHLAFRRPGLDP